MAETLDPVFQRTTSGQEQALTNTIALEQQARQLLLLVNGFSPLSVLRDRLLVDIEPHIEKLVSLRLIQAHADDHGQRSRLDWLVSQAENALRHGKIAAAQAPAAA